MAEQDPLILDILPSEKPEKKNVSSKVFKIIRNFDRACNQKRYGEIRKVYKENSSFFDKIGISEDLTTITKKILLNQTERGSFREKVIDSILRFACEQSRDDIERLFFLAARYQSEELQEVINKVGSSEDIKRTKCSDTAIIFALKYGRVDNENFVSCMTMLFEAGVDINKFDFEGKTAIDHVAILHEIHKNDFSVVENLQRVAAVFLQNGIFQHDNKTTVKFLTQLGVDTENFPPMDEKTKIFLWTTRNNVQELLHFEGIDSFVNSDDGENTLLQLASQKTDKMLPVVRLLLAKGANPNLTSSNELTPLEHAGFMNSAKIFEELLRNNKTIITEKQFFRFVKWRTQPMKAKLFELLLESDKLDADFVCGKTGNSPLHFAVLFSHKKAIQLLLRRRPCRLMRVLDIIDPEDLEEYFDYCLASDNYTDYFTDSNCKMLFRFGCLIDENLRQTRVVTKIGRQQNLEHLLTHPFIHTFLALKWFKVKTFFWIVLLFQSVIFLSLSLLFYQQPNTPLRVVCGVIAVVNIATKAPIFLACKFKNRRCDFFVLRRAALHSCLEILLMVTTIGSLFQDQFRAFVFVEMAILFLLTAGYHPKISKRSVMLQQVFTTFSELLLFFSVIIIAFGMGFQILFAKEKFFGNIGTSVFKSFIMTTGEFNLEDVSLFESSGFGGYMLFFLFAMSISLVIVNFWTGIAVTDIERIEKNSKVNAAKNVIVFMQFTDFIYSGIIKRFPRTGSWVNPLLFSETKKEDELYYCNFYVNREKQFDVDSLPTKVDMECFDKIKKHHNKLKRITNQQEVLNDLKDIKKMLEDLKANSSKRS